VTERLSCEKPVAQDANFILSSSKMSRVVIPNFSKHAYPISRKVLVRFSKARDGFFAARQG
jgi:hypothetical protein